jgi:phospholipid N-methyltransferase
VNGNNPTRSSQTLLFARNFLKHPKMLGSIIPSSRFLVNHLLDLIDFERARFIVEYGPGIGNITKQVLARMRPDARLVAIEMNADFVDYLKEELRDPRLHVIRGSAEEVSSVLASLNLAHADYIISGIPYSTMPAPLRSRILQESRRVLHPEGAFVVYQFTRTVLPYLEPIFARVDQDFEPLNILPARLFYCTP